MYKYCYSNEGAIYAKGLLCQKNQTKQFLFGTTESRDWPRPIMRKNHPLDRIPTTRHAEKLSFYTLNRLPWVSVKESD